MVSILLKVMLTKESVLRDLTLRYLLFLIYIMFLVKPRLFAGRFFTILGSVMY